MTAPTPAQEMRGRIDIRGVSKLYHRPGSPPVQALLPVDLPIAPGEFVSLVGPSGCGKTKLMMTICDLLDPTNRTIASDPPRGPGPSTRRAPTPRRPRPSGARRREKTRRCTSR